ncbi:response regulator [Pseudodesulfovibrio sp.]|uniref:response regulator n=1 Tax=Pseudodesulfovibrio sp. TaxID=2035812 RepID=UPI002611782F|nr:response regulator [Pseudodesulfovibrio sp.]MDD3312215.1 response regulator [Pseudodesulfovibrio sp.]
MHVLLIDADDDFRRNLADRLSKRGLTVLDTGDAEEAARLARGENAEAILAGLSSPKEPLLYFLSELRQERPESTVILINHSGEVSLSIEAMKLGVVDEAGVPVDLEDLLGKLRAAVASRKSGH